MYVFFSMYYLQGCIFCVTWSLMIVYVSKMYDRIGSLFNDRKRSCMKISYSWPLQLFTLQTITFAQYPVSNKALYVLERTLTRKRLTHRERPSQSTHRNRTSHPRDDHPPLGTTFWGVFWLPSSLVLTHALTTLRAHTYTQTHTYILTYVRWGGR